MDTEALEEFFKNPTKEAFHQFDQTIKLLVYEEALRIPEEMRNPAIKDILSWYEEGLQISRLPDDIFLKISEYLPSEEDTILFDLYERTKKAQIQKIYKKWISIQKLPKHGRFNRIKDITRIDQLHQIRDQEAIIGLSFDATFNQPIETLSNI